MRASTTLGSFSWDTWKVIVRTSTLVWFSLNTRPLLNFVVIDHPLASGFPISTGSVRVTMPQDIPPRDDYFVVRESLLSLVKETMQTKQKSLVYSFR